MPSLVQGLDITEPQVGHLINAYALGQPSDRVRAQLPRDAGVPLHRRPAAWCVLRCRDAGRGIDQRPRPTRAAISKVMLGLSIAILVGNPLATWLGQVLSWRYTFALVRDIMELLRGSNDSTADRLVFFRAQLLFWLMAATDGHAKNFSLTLLPGGAYQLTPLYDILSAYPIQGRGMGRLEPRDAKLAMAVIGRNRHYKVREIHRWHWTSMATQLGLETAPGELITALVAATPRVLDQVGESLPERFPRALYEVVRNEMLAAAKRLEAKPDLRGSAGNTG